MVESDLIRIYPASRAQMEALIAAEKDGELKKAYREMLDGCLAHPERWEWFAAWFIEKADGTRVGDLCFKGLEPGKNPEIGYGILEEYQGQGCATEAVKLAARWAFERPEVTALEAETAPENAASQRVLEKCGFKATGVLGEEGPRFILFKEKKMAEVNGCVIRLETKDDYRTVENLVRESFWNVYRPGCYEHYVIHVLRDDPAFVPELDFVMEKDGRIIGQNMFMKTVVQADDGGDVPVLTMGPIGIVPDLKRQGYGKALLDYSLEKAAGLGFGAVLFEGNIGFYGKSGFDYASKFGIRYHDLPEGADSSFFLCKELKPGYLDNVVGVYQTPRGYYVSGADVDEFDKGFPPKVKQKLPGQIFE